MASAASGVTGPGPEDPRRERMVRSRPPKRRITAAAHGAGSADPRRAIAGLIEREVVPRLLLASTAHAPTLGALTRCGPAPDHAAPDEDAPAWEPASFTAEEIETFCTLVVAADPRPAEALVQRYLAAGVPLDGLLIGLFARAARRLGERWEADLTSFFDVTVGMCRIERAVAVLSASYAGRSAPIDAIRLLLAPAPGEQHRLGLLLVAEGLRREGFDVVVLDEEMPDIEALLGMDWFDALGFSLAAPERAPRLARFVARLRRVSRNPRLHVLAGGRAFDSGAVTPQDVGADAMAGSVPDAAKHLRKTFHKEAGTTPAHTNAG